MRFHFLYWEVKQWPDRSALDTHCASEHFRRLVPMIDQHKRKDATYILMDRFNEMYRKLLFQE